MSSDQKNQIASPHAFKITYPEELPVSTRREEIMEAMRDHQVIIVSGETGSGKTTQLPKMALALGRGIRHANGSKKLIGHTQPRRIAASSVAKRIAEELQTPFGEVVGFKVRFQDTLSDTASVKVMTDGILLAEIQSDPELRAYDTLIIDEAHERSLNIDFILGYLKQLLPRRPDLKLIVTSATIDAKRFAEHFASHVDGKLAPVITVSGRLYPVEMRYAPFEESKDYSINEAIADAVDELWKNPHEGGDILVFLPGEREIRDAADHLNKYIANRHTRWGVVEVLPLFARLSPQDQDRIFHPKSARRIVLATNVAETSLTVPGIRFVIDSGLARVKRYSYRNKVDQLLVEPISQAAANQRAGRCGRVTNGVCIRLYDEADFFKRTEFTDPEILRSSLAGVILRMKSIRLGDVAAFPFIEPPAGRAIADGYALLAEIGAVDEKNSELTPMGEMLSHLPLDPRIGRMIVEAKDRQALTEVLVVAAAMSVQDVRDRPLELQQKADEKHKQFDDERSEFLGTVRLWQWLEGLRGHSLFAEANGQAKPVEKPSNRQQEQRMRDFFINPRRVREWRDVHTQLLTVVRQNGWRRNTQAASYEQLHLSLLSGLLGNIGCKSNDEEWYLGAHSIKFWVHPGAHLSKKPGRWVIAAEQVQTSRLFGRDVANIQPVWLETMGKHLLKKQLLDPHWEKKAAEVVALERATLYGVVVYTNRKVNYGRVDPKTSREIFIREALVNGDWESDHAFLQHNQKLIRQIEGMEHKARRQDLLVDDELIYAFYDQHVPGDIVSGHTFDTWYINASRKNKKLLFLNRDELMRHEASGITTDAFPRTITLGAVSCKVSYLHEPGHARDGMTVTVPIYGLNQVDEGRCEWLVPGMLKEKIVALLKQLHQKPRSRLMPLPDYAQKFIDAHEFGQGSLLEQLVKAIREKTSQDVKRTDFRLENLAPHFYMNFIVVDESGRQLGMGRDLTALKAEHGRLARHTFQSLAALKVQTTSPSATEAKERGVAKTAHQATQLSSTLTEFSSTEQRYTTWDFGELPELMEISKGKQTLIGFPALVDEGDAVHIEVFDEADVAAREHRAGLRRLISLQIKDALKYFEKNIPNLQRMYMMYMSLGSSDDLKDQMVALALDRAFLSDKLPTDAASFEQCLTQGRARLQLIGQEISRQAEIVLTEYATAVRKVKDSRAPEAVREDIQTQLERLLPKRFIVQTPWVQLQHLPRYLKAIVMRLDKLSKDPMRDDERFRELKPLEQRYYRKLSEQKGQVSEQMQTYRWMLEELRVSFFAQELKTPYPISVKRLEKAWTQLQGL